MSALLDVTELVKEYTPGGVLRAGHHTVRAVNGVSLAIARGETLGLVGESGSGKSTLGRAILHLDAPTSGRVTFDGVALATLKAADLRRMRRRMQVIFQDTGGALNPRRTVGDAISEGLHIHHLLPRAGIPERVAALLTEVGLDPAFASRYPHELSGGQRQRIGIARALAVEPEFIVCDEPVSALDVSIQAQVLNLLVTLRERRGLAYLFIAHDLAVVRHVAHRIAVMYLGTIVEIGTADAVIRQPRHPYTQALISAVPDPDPDRQRTRIVLEGEPSSPTGTAAGCPFAARCGHPQRDARCMSERPVLRPLGTQEVACHHAR
ncbi:MAG TPA: oligopeptide/dipeptide ABC transporter ATP-binding protein [Gemmatimonadales bacterium]|nr:oligopeptide/dipeptide ABC transporter ATP-binding protein [Gemmatimonadales bacterium]